MRAGYLALCWAFGVRPTPAAAVELDFGIVKTLEHLSLPVPDPANPIVCHGFGCAYRTPILLRNADTRRSRSCSSRRPQKIADDERKAVAATMAWFEKRVAAEAGTANAKARAGLGHAGDPSQFDCLDKTSNTIGVLAIVAQMGLLRHHVIDVPESRGGHRPAAHTARWCARRGAARSGWSTAGPTTTANCPTSCRWRRWRTQS